MIAEARSRIDEIDDELACLFARRLSLAGEIAAWKKENNMPIRDGAREREIVGRLTDGKPDDVADGIEALFAAIFDISRAYQAKAQNALGPGSPGAQGGA